MGCNMMPIEEGYMSKKHETLTVADIEARRAEMATRLDGVQAARRDLALSIVEGDADAGARDVKLGEKQKQYETALQQFDDALAAARVREAAARREAEAAAARAKASDIRQRLQFFRQHGADLDLAARTLVESYAKFEAEVLEMARMGVGPSPALVRTNCRRGLEAALMPTTLKVSHLGPTERHSFADLVKGWASGIEAQARQLERDGAMERVA
jgi:hypothetical protein